MATPLNRASWLRAVVFAICAASIALTPYDMQVQLPDEMRRAFGIGGLLVAQKSMGWLFNTTVGLQSLKWLAVASCVGVIVWPRRSRPLVIVAAITIVALDAVSRSIVGYASHGHLTVLLVVIIMAVFWRVPFASPWDDGPQWSQEVEDTHEAILRLSLLTLVVPYTFVGIARLVDGGSEIFTGDMLLTAIRKDSARASAYGFALAPRVLELPGVSATLRVGFAVTTMFEALSGLVFVSRTFRLLWLLAMLCFHMLTLLSMNIFFWQNVVVMIVGVGYGLAGDSIPVVRDPPHEAAASE